MAASYKKPAGESSLLGGVSGMKHQLPLSKDELDKAADHVAVEQRHHSDEDSYSNDPGAKEGEGSAPGMKD